MWWSCSCVHSKLMFEWNDPLVFSLKKQISRWADLLVVREVRSGRSWWAYEWSFLIWWSCFRRWKVKENYSTRNDAGFPRCKVHWLWCGDSPQFWFCSLSQAKKKINKNKIRLATNFEKWRIQQKQFLLCFSLLLYPTKTTKKKKRYSTFIPKQFWKQQI